MVSSKIYLNELVENAEHKFGEAKEYYPVKIYEEDGETKWAMFTESDIEQAIIRANKNREDIPKSLWQSLFG